MLTMFDVKIWHNTTPLQLQLEHHLLTHIHHMLGDVDNELVNILSSILSIDG